jgi:sialate O-acetylesterase
LFKALINDWRNSWHDDHLPFLFVQLANLRSKPKEPSGSSWAELREAQAMALTLPNTGMAVIHDIGEWNDIHPLNKLDVGKRLALAAQKVAYGDKAVVYSGPTYQSMHIKGNQCIIQFTNTGTGLMVKDGGTLSMFAIAGADQKFVWANARIEGDKVIVWSDTVTDPVAVRYAWADNPEGANLYNQEGLPASSFRTDDWKGLTFNK